MNFYSHKCCHLILGVGSLSHLSVQRLLPKTYDYFTNALKGITLSGYNAVGDGATGALLPLLTGKIHRLYPCRPYLPHPLSASSSPRLIIPLSHSLSLPPPSLSAS